MGVDEHANRRLTINELHDEMDKQVANKASRFQYASLMRDSATQWDLVAATVEEANTNYHGPTGRDVARMRCRSRITYNTSETHP